ncbi:12868_t:CDS:2, partial [Gigaspora margarita]
KIIQSLNLPSWEELDNTVNNLNKMWDSFEKGFLFAAKRNFLTKRILFTPEKSKMNSKTCRTDLHQDTFSLSQISREIKKYIDSIQRTEWPKIFEKTNMQLHEINIRHEIGIQLINKATNLKEIENFIKLRCKRIQNKQSKMLNSLLDRPYNKIKIDRVLDQKEENLVTHATKVKNKTQAFFQSQYKKRNTSLEDLPDKWKEIYKPQEWINEGIYKELNGRESCEITIAKEMVKAEKKDTLVRFLGIYFNSSLKEAILVKKAKEIICQIVRALYSKKLTIS